MSPATGREGSGSVTTKHAKIEQDRLDKLRASFDALCAELVGDTFTIKKKSPYRAIVLEAPGLDLIGLSALRSWERSGWVAHVDGWTWRIVEEDE